MATSKRFKFMSNLPCRDCLLLSICINQEAEQLMEKCDIIKDYLVERKYHNNLKVLREYKPKLEFILLDYDKSLEIAISFNTQVRKYVLTW